ncbi:unnamed protein product, partial [Rotaria socialis]
IPLPKKEEAVQLIIINKDTKDRENRYSIDKAHSTLQFLFIEHGAYKAKSLHSRRRQIDSLTASTY